MTFEHFVLFRLFDGVEVGGVIEKLDAAAPSDAVSWLVAPSLDERKGVIVVEKAVFASRAAFESWRASEAHREAASYMSERSDWWVADLEL